MWCRLCMLLISISQLIANTVYVPAPEFPVDYCDRGFHLLVHAFDQVDRHFETNNLCQIVNSHWSCPRSTGKFLVFLVSKF